MPFLAVDTETTGLTLYHGCKPFMVQACDERGNTFLWEWEVDPYTRKPIISENDVGDIAATFEGHDLVFHNAVFDLQALKTIGISVDPDFHTVHDTMLSSHVLDSRGPHDLKTLALRHLDILDDDEKELEDAAKSARLHRIPKELQWRIAKEGDPLFAGLDKGWHKMDYWLPRQVRLAWEYSPRSDPETPKKLRWKEPPESWKTVASTYGLRDVERTIQLFLFHQELLKSEGLTHIYERERRLIPVTWNLIRRGVHVHKKRLQHELDRFQAEVDEAEKSLQYIARPYFGFGLSKSEFNVRSHPQLAKVLYEDLKLPVLKRTESEQPATDAKTIDALQEYAKETYVSQDANQFLDALGHYRKPEKALTYLRSYRKFVLPDYDAYGNVLGYVLHPGYRQNGTSTTRFGCREPNVQNISKGKETDEVETSAEGVETKKVDYRLRFVFGPAPGRIWFPMDYQQLQLRIFAFVSEEQSLIQAFEDGWDFHNYVASRLFKTDHPSSLQRRTAKNVNFGLIFGAGPAKIDATSGVPGTYDAYRKQFPNIDAYMDRILKQVKRKGYVTTPFGYRLYVPRDRPYAGVNYIVQGCEGDIVKNAMLGCHRYLEQWNKSEKAFALRVPAYKGLMGKLGEETGEVYMTLMVHDELVFDFPNRSEHAGVFWEAHLRELKHQMEKAGSQLGMVTPVDVSVVEKVWSEPKKYSLAS